MGLLLLADKIEEGPGRQLCRPLSHPAQSRRHEREGDGRPWHRGPLTQVLWASTYGISYTMIVLGAAVLIFRSGTSCELAPSLGPIGLLAAIGSACLSMRSHGVDALEEPR